MLSLAVVIGLLSSLSAVLADTPTKDSLLSEVNALLDLVDNVMSRVNATETYRISQKVDAVDRCWIAKSSTFQDQIQQAVKDMLTPVQKKLTDTLNKVPYMDDDQIAQLDQELYVQTGGLLEQAEDIVTQFNQKVSAIHKKVLRLNTLDC